MFISNFNVFFFPENSKPINGNIAALYFDNDILTCFLLPHYSPRDDSSTKNDKVIQLIERLTTEEASWELRKVLDKGTKQDFVNCPLFQFEQDLRIYELLEML